MASSQPIQLFALFIVIAWQVSSARCDETDFFREYIEPLLKTNCYDCHSHEAGEASGGLVLDSKAGWSVGGDSGPTIVPGALDKSLLWQVVNYQRPGLEMPPDGKLADSDLALIQKWIESGAMDPREDGRAAERKQIDLEAGRQWWAFQPIKASSMADQRPQAVSRIDWFIGQRLQAAGLKSEAQADRQTLLRRVSYDGRRGQKGGRGEIASEADCTGTGRTGAGSRSG